jgi:hypothetical protein
MAVFAAQNLSIFSDKPAVVTQAPARADVAVTRPASPPRASVEVTPAASLNTPRLAVHSRQNDARVVRAQSRQHKAALAAATATKQALPNVNVMMRDTEGDLELSMSPVSIGAQSVILTNSSRATARNVAVSF